MNAWESAMRDPNLTMADRIAAFKALKSERLATDVNAKSERDAKGYVPAAHLKAFKTTEDQELALKIAPKVFAALVEEWQSVATTKTYDEAKLISFANVFGAGKDIMGKEIKPKFAFLTYAPQDVVLGRKSIDSINYTGQVGKGGLYGEWLALLAVEYQKVFGNLNFLAKPTLTKG